MPEGMRSRTGPDCAFGMGFLTDVGVDGGQLGTYVQEEDGFGGG